MRYKIYFSICLTTILHFSIIAQNCHFDADSNLFLNKDREKCNEIYKYQDSVTKEFIIDEFKNGKKIYTWTYDSLWHPIENRFYFNKTEIYSTFNNGYIYQHSINLGNHYFLSVIYAENGNLISYKEFLNGIRKSFDFFETGELSGFCICNENKKKPCLTVSYHQSDGKIELTDYIIPLKPLKLDSNELFKIPEEYKNIGYYWKGPQRFYLENGKVYDESYSKESRTYKHVRYLKDGFVEIVFYDENLNEIKTVKKRLWHKGLFTPKFPRRYSQERMTKKFNSLYPH